MNLKEPAIEKMKDIFGTDEKRIEHALKVLNYAEEILSGEKMTGSEAEVVILTAILHDIGIHEAERKYNSNSGRYQEIEGPPIAKAILEALRLDSEIVERVCYIIGGHHTWSKNDGKDFQIIWEADMLVNIQDEGVECFGPNIKSVIDKNFKTPTGKKLAQETLNT